jgi:hypothetical protein
MLVKLEMSCLPLRLETLLASRSLRQQHGGQIILMLLRGLQKLADAELYSRGISPTTVTFTEELDQVMFCDITSICSQNIRPSRDYYHSAPHSAAEMTEFK